MQHPPGASLANLGRRPRGRPQRLPVDTTPPTRQDIDGGKRLAWLLATSRLIGTADAASRSDFVSRLRADGVRADSSRISRWESGLEPVPPRLVRAYETATGAAPYSLIAIRQLLVRKGHLEDAGGGAHDPGSFNAERVDRIMDRVHSRSMHGDLWLQLATELARYDHVYLHQSVWRSTADLLVDELSRSVGIAYLRRYETAVAFLTSGAARAHLSKSVGQFTLEPGGQLKTRVLAVLGEDPDKAVHDLLIRMVRSDQPNLARSAALVASQMVSRGFVARDEQVLETHLSQALAARRSPRLSSAVIDLACNLADAPFQRLLRGLEPAAERHRLHRMRETSEVIEVDDARQISDSVALHAEAVVGRQAHEPDQMLRGLVREALFHVHHHRRSLASTLLMASPYAAALAEGSLVVSRSDDVEIAARGWAMTRRLASAADSELLGQAVAAENRSALQQHALNALACSPGRVSASVVEQVTSLVRNPATDVATALAGAGVLGAHRLIHHVLDVPREEVQTAIAWWRRAGGAIHES